MTLLQEVQQASYPVYQVQAVVNVTQSENGNVATAGTVSFLISSFNAGAGTTFGDLSQSLFGALKSWMQNYNWAQYNSSPFVYSLGSFSVEEATQQSEQLQNVTP
jgi:hypothetical protein